MKNILLPTDFSENSWNAIKYILNFFKNTACNFYILHVNELSTVASGDTPYLPSYEAIENLYTKPAKRKLKKLLIRVSAEFPNNKLHKFYTLTDYNFFIKSIRKHVEEKHIDMIVMGTKGASGLKQYIVGSNTGDVITKVKCATLVVPEKATYKTIKEIAFPTDYELSYDIRTLLPLSDILRNTKSSLRILHINKKNEKLNIEQQEHKELLEAIFEEHEYSSHLLTNTKVEDAIQCFVESRDIDMMVMVAKNLNYFQQILFHSKVEKISYHITIPFLVLHDKIQHY
jgi:nucleotide-binding universal stress UspA family protein